MSGAMKQECGRKLKAAADALRQGDTTEAAKLLDEAGDLMLQSEDARKEELKKYKKKDE